MRKFKSDLSLWWQWIEFCKASRASKQLSRVITKALQRHATVAALWLEAAAWCVPTLDWKRLHAAPRHHRALQARTHAQTHALLGVAARGLKPLWDSEPSLYHGRRYSRDDSLALAERCTPAAAACARACTPALHIHMHTHTMHAHLRVAALMINTNIKLNRAESRKVAVDSTERNFLSKQRYGPPHLACYALGIRCTWSCPLSPRRCTPLPA